MQYTIRNVPQAVDSVLRERARAQGKSLNQVLLEALFQAAGLEDPPHVRRNLSEVAGTWEDDPEVDLVLSEQRYIDPDLWS